ncbi:fimbrial protein [Vibrio algicola]|nr:fimbrial protein [Vibrio algicola]
MFNHAHLLKIKTYTFGCLGMFFISSSAYANCAYFPPAGQIFNRNFGDISDNYYTAKVGDVIASYTESSLTRMRCPAGTVIEARIDVGSREYGNIYRVPNTNVGFMITDHVGAGDNIFPGDMIYPFTLTLSEPYTESTAPREVKLYKLSKQFDDAVNYPRTTMSGVGAAGYWNRTMIAFSIKVPTCTMEDQVVNMGERSSVDIQKGTVEAASFTIRGQCIKKTNIALTYTPLTDIFNAEQGIFSLFTTGDYAKGVGIKLMDANSNPILFNQPISISQSGDNSFSVNLKAKYVPTTGKITAGEANSAVSVNITYP